MFKKPPWQKCGPRSVCSGSTLFASILNSLVMLGNYLQQTTSADDIFRCIFFLGALRVNYKDYFIRDVQPCSFGVANKSGWMIAQHFLDYIKHFVKHTGPLKTTLFSCYLTITNLILLSMSWIMQKTWSDPSIVPPHFSHEFQPLDR